MYWLTENAFQPLMLGLLIVGATGAFGYVLKERRLLITAGIVFVLTLGIVITEQLIVTHKEQLVIEINSAAAAVSRNDRTAVLNHISPNYEEGIADVNHYMSVIDFSSVTVNNLVVNHEPQGTTARLEFNARVAADATQASEFGMEGVGLVAATLDYELSADGRWQIVNYDYRRIKPNDFFRNND